jgi:hypothetical protein
MCGQIYIQPTSGKPKQKWDNTVKMDVKEMRQEGVN